MSDRKDLPQPSAANFNQRMRETVMTYLGRQGNYLDRGLTIRDFLSSGFAALAPGYNPGGGGGTVPIIPGPGIPPVYSPDLTPPPTPTGFGASTSRTMIQVYCDPQTYRQGHGHKNSIVYGAGYQEGDALPVFANSIKLTEFSGDVFAFPVDPGALYRLWLTWVSNDGVEGLPAGGTNGIEAEAGLLDSAHIAFLTASKIRTGTISVGVEIFSSNYVSNLSGWRINGAGNAEYNNVTVRGTIYASAGLIGGNTIDTTGIESINYVPGTEGWRFDTSGLIRAFADSGSRVIDMAATGTSPVLKVGAQFQILGNGNATFGGALSAATGTFSGALSAATGTFSGALSAATGTFSGALNAATGTFSGSLTADAINAVNSINIAGNSVSVTATATGDDQEISTTLFVPAGENMVITAIVVYDRSDEINTGLDGNNFPDESYVTIDGDTISVQTLVDKREVTDTTFAFTRQMAVNMHMLTVNGGVSGLTCTVSASNQNAFYDYEVEKRLIAFGLLR